MLKFKTKNNLPLYARITAVVIVFAIALLCAVSLLVPPRQLHFEKYVPQEDDLVAEIFSNEIKYFNGCNISSDGSITITGGDAHFVVSGHEKEIQVVKLNFKKPSVNEYCALLYFDDGSDFSEINTVRQYVFVGDTDVCFKIPASINKNIRIDIDNDYTFESVELHSKEPDVIKTQLPVSAGRCVMAVLIAALVSICFFFIDKYVYPVSEKIKLYYFKEYKKILSLLLILLSGVLLSIGIEYLLGRFVFGLSSMDTYFNMYRYFFILCVVSAVLLLIYHIKNGAKNPERLFVGLMLLAGISMILCSPFGHICWDFDSHTQFVFEQASYGDGYMTVADEAIFYNKGLAYSDDSAANNLANIEYFNETGDIVVDIREDANTTIAHIPAGIAVAVSRFLGFPYVTTVMFGRMANLLLYVVLCYWAMRKLISGKMILATIAFFPTNIFLATNYSYDFWVTAFMFVGMAYFISEIQQPDKSISALDTFIMCAMFILACMPKQIYMPIMVLPLFMYKKWKNTNERKKYYIICILMFILMFVLLLIRSQSSITGGGDTRGGSGVNSMGQVQFILSEPLHYTKILLRFLSDYLSLGTMKLYIANFAYMGMGGGAWIFIALLIFTSVTDKGANDRFKKLNLLRIISILLFFALSCLVATSLYVAYTPVASETIAGCQPRYLIPILFPLLVVIASPGIKLKIKKEIYNTVILSVLSTTVFYNVSAALLGKLM